jgi:6-phosphogluconolactonase
MGDDVRGPGTRVRAGSVEVLLEDDAGAVARVAADLLAGLLRKALARRGEAALALSGGNTPREAYALLARASGIDWSKVSVYWVDERAVPPDHERSNYRAAKATLLDAAGIPPARVHRMCAEQSDLARAAADYGALLGRELARGATGSPVIDVMVIGMGDDGHTASLFPGEPTVLVADRAVVAVPASAGREARMTLTAPVIQAASNVIALVVGAGKHAPLLRAWAAEGDVRQTPVRVVRSCQGTVTWITDRAAAGSARPE